MTKVKVKDKVKYISESNGYFTNEEMYPVVENNESDGDVVVLDDGGTRHILTSDYLLQNFVKISNKERITALETEVKRLDKFSESLRAELTGALKRIESLEAKLVENVAIVEKSANQLRAEIIEKAEAFVIHTATDDTHFEINGNIVLAWRIINKGTGYVALTGLAVCSPNDVFNEEIGRAIAVGRMEGLNVSEFENAVHPTEFTVGQVITFVSEDAGEYKGCDYTISEIKDEQLWLGDVFYHQYWGADWQPKVIDDTNAQY